MATTLENILGGGNKPVSLPACKGRRQRHSREGKPKITLLRRSPKQTPQRRTNPQSETESRRLQYLH